MNRTTAIALVCLGLCLGAAVVPAAVAAQEDDDSSGDELDGEYYYPAPQDEESGGSPVALLWNPVVVGAVLVVGTGVAAVLERRAPSPEDDADEDPSPAERRRRAIGRAAGQLAADLAADRDAERLFESWLELADSLGVRDPETVEREELRRAATDAGLAPGYAESLADQYDVLRYGGAATSERQRAAIEVLEDVEAEYVEDEDEGGNETTDGPEDGDAEH